MSGKHRVQLSIGGFSILLFSEWELRLDVGYTHFVTNPEAKPDILVECFEGMPVDILSGAELVFQAANAEKMFYSIYRSGENLVFAVYNQQNRDEIQQLAQLDDSLSRWKIWMKQTDNVLEPLLFPMGPILLHYTILQSDAVMMHGSSIFDGEKGRLFSGFSGAGKSTISKIWADSGSLLINDDRVIIRKEVNGYFVYNTPMYYADVPKRAPLDAVYLISHSPINKIAKCKGAKAITGIMAFSIQNNYEHRFVKHHLDFFSELCSTVPIYELGFVPDRNVISLIKENV